MKATGAEVLLACVRLYPKQVAAGFESIFGSVTKAVEESRAGVYAELMGELVQLELNPTADLRQLATNRRISGPPQNLMEAVSVLSSVLAKSTSTFESRVAGGIALKSLLVKLAPICCQTVTDLGVLMDSLLSVAAKSLGNEVDNWRNLEIICWVASSVVVDSLSDSQRQQVLEYVLNKLSTLKNMRTEELEGKRPNSASDYQATVCLRLFEPLASCLSETALKAYGDSLFQPLLEFMNSARHSKYTTRALAAITYRVHSMQAKLIYKMIEMSTVAHAEISALKVGDVTRTALAESINNLYGNCLALGNVLKAISISGVPDELLNYALGTAKSLISGQYQPEHIEEQVLADKEVIPMECDYSRQEGGWLIIEGIVRMRGSWISSHIVQLISLWKLPFGEKRCILEQNLSTIQLTFEVRHKRAASSSLAAFMQNHEDLVSASVAKHVGVCLTNVLKFLEPQQDRSQRKQMLEMYNASEVLVLKHNVFQCLLKLPLKTYVHSYVPLLHSICGELVSEKLTAHPDVYRSWMSSDDLLVEEPDSPLPLYDQSPQLYQESCFDTWLGLPLQARFHFPLQRVSLLVHVLNNAVQLFAELFTSPVININNRLQLFKHLFGHVQSTNKLKDSVPLKTFKLVTILTACLGCLRKLNAQEEVIKDLELIQTLKAIVSAMEGSPHPLIKKLHSLLAVYLCKASPEPNYVQTFLK